MFFSGFYKINICPPPKKEEKSKILKNNTILGYSTLPNMFHFNGHTTGTCPHRLKSYNILKRPHHVHCRVYMLFVGYCIFRCDFCKPTIGGTSCYSEQRFQ